MRASSCMATCIAKSPHRQHVNLAAPAEPLLQQAGDLRADMQQLIRELEGCGAVIAIDDVSGSLLDVVIVALMHRPLREGTRIGTITATDPRVIYVDDAGSRGCRRGNVSFPG